MFDRIEDLILGTLQLVFDQFGWVGVFGLMAFENATGITPSEIILTFAGWLLISSHGYSPALILFGGLVAAAGSTLGASITYWLARLGGRPLIDRLARLVRIDPAMITAIEQQFQRWGPGLVLAGRMLPGIRTLVSIPAGLARMSFPVFLAATFSGTYLWCSLLIGAGYLLGQEWMLISSLLKQSLPYLLAAGAGVLAAYAYIRYRTLPAPALVRVDEQDWR